MNMPESTPGPSAPLFDRYAEDYEEACQRGLALSGESRDHFAARRVEATAAWLLRLGQTTVRRLADFGCGRGLTTPHFQRLFPQADVLGLDISRTSVARARDDFAGPARFKIVTEFAPSGDQDLVYCNGVFHHIPPGERLAWVRYLLDLLAPGGWLALWENNPWNPGTRWVMKRIPFDRDAIPIYPHRARRLVAAGGFLPAGTHYHFYFPRCLAWLRRLEPLAIHVPLGAQYCLLARKPAPPR
jgi:SAM-dependent methyltransferase